MDKVLEIQFSGWTATPRMPFILSGNAVCLHTPTYSLILGIIGCCLGRLIAPNEVQIGFHYSFDSVANDLETRQRLKFNGKKIEKHSKGTDVYSREFHVSPKLTIWINRLDWEEYFRSPIGTPSLGRSQDILIIESIKQIQVKAVKETELSGAMIPFNTNVMAGGQLVQLAEAYQENTEIGAGRRPTGTGIFLSIPHDSKANVKLPNLFITLGETPKGFYLHNFGNGYFF